MASTTGVLWGKDISGYQGLMIDEVRARQEGFDFTFVKATQGDGFTNAVFGQQYDRVRASGQLAVPYVFLESGPSARAQADYAHSKIPAGAPVAPDAEWVKDAAGRLVSAPTLAQTVEFSNRMRDYGHHVPCAYVPHWYWEFWGSPDMSALACPLWSSRYPSMNGGFASQLYQQVPDNYWDGYGGLGVAILQFSSAATVAGYHPVDVDAFRGTRDQLSALLFGAPASASAQQKFFLVNG
jgi:GH25 family lysozyme M1 (1,4-beta-N-acetylmuramidase)